MRHKGDQLEKRVEKLLQQMGYTTQRGVHMKDKHGNRHEIDVVAKRLFSTRYVECKNYSAPVPLKDVAMHKERLAQLGLPLSSALFITTSSYSPRAKHAGIELWDGPKLKAMEAKASRRWIRGLLARVVAASALGGVIICWQAPFLEQFLDIVTGELLMGGHEAIGDGLRALSPTAADWYERSSPRG